MRVPYAGPAVITPLRAAGFLCLPFAMPRRSVLVFPAIRFHPRIVLSRTRSCPFLLSGLALVTLGFRIGLTALSPFRVGQVRSDSVSVG